MFNFSIPLYQQMYAKSGAYKNLNLIIMNKNLTTTNLMLIAICMVTYSFVGISCTSLQQATTMASDDLYTTPSNNKNTNVSNKRVITTENWGVPNKVQNAGKAQQISNSDNQAVVSDTEEYQEYQDYQDDRYLRLKVANRNRWSVIDDWSYWNDPRFNNAFYPSYLGWNSWYTGYYGASWYAPFGAGYSMGWGGYSPYSMMYAGMGWGFYDPFGFDLFGYGGMGYGGFGFGYGYGGWNPYYAGMWNPYRPMYPGGFYTNHGFSGNMQQPGVTRAMQNGPVALNAYRNNRGFNNINNVSNTSTTTAAGNIRYTGNPTLNNNFGSLIKRVVTNNTNVNNANSFDRPVRYFSNNNSANNNYRAANSNYSTQSSQSNQSTNNSNNTGGRSGGYISTGTSTGSARAPRSQNP